jgi:hypothetical protein
MEVLQSEYGWRRARALDVICRILWAAYARADDPGHKRYWDLMKKIGVNPSEARDSREKACAAYVKLVHFYEWGVLLDGRFAPTTQGSDTAGTP